MKAPLFLDGVKLIHSPFTCAVLPNFLESVKISALEDEARRFPLNRRLNDLFSINQSGDLKALCKNAKLAEKFPLLYQIRSVGFAALLEWKQIGLLHLRLLSLSGSSSPTICCNG